MVRSPQGDLKWTTHINNITKKANSTMSFIRRNISSCPPKAKSNAYQTYVRPTIEYASTVWSPHTECLTNQVEMVQRRAARFVKHDYARTSSVTDMITDLKWDTLQHRRNVARVSMLYKITNNLVDITPNPPLRNARSSTRGHHLQFTQMAAKKSIFQHSFYPVTIILWNRLPPEAVSQPTLVGFQTALGRLSTI